MLYVFSSYFFGNIDEQHTEDEKDSESLPVLSLNEKETDCKGVYWSKKPLLGL